MSYKHFARARRAQKAVADYGGALPPAFTRLKDSQRAAPQKTMLLARPLAAVAFAATQTSDDKQKIADSVADDPEQKSSNKLSAY